MASPCCPLRSFFIPPLTKLLFHGLCYDTHNIQQLPHRHVLHNWPHTLLKLQSDQVFQYASFDIPPPPVAPDPSLYSQIPS
eukprot:2706296-Ditylum_brightwellii.AAC.1